MNILFLDQFSDLGGAQLCLIDLLPAIREEGWNAVVAAPGDGKLFPACERSGCVTHRLDLGPYHSGRKSLGDVLRFAADVPVAARRIRKLMKQHAIDLVYANGPRVVLPAAAAVGATPLIFHCHSFISQRYQAALINASLRHCRSRMIACCNFVARPFVGHNPEIVFNGVADQARQRSLRDHSRIGIIGRISPEKGQAEFLRAAHALLKRVPDCRFVICGAASDRRYEQEVRRLASGLPVEFTGWRDDVGDVLSKLDLLVVPSAFTEATARVIPEAFSAGVLVAAHNAGGIQEIVTHGENGFLMDSLEPGALAEACVQALAADRTRICQQARRCFEDRFTLPRFRSGVLGAIRSFIPQAQK
jgi:glycosyltransferase involved in cell wall biosynthesis